MKVRLSATGTRPLLMHNVRLASPLNPYAKKLKSLNGKRVKTDEDRLEIARVEWEGGLYFEPELGPYLPGANLFRSLINGARLTKAGKKIERGVTVMDLYLPLLYQGPRDLDGLWGGGESEYVDIRPAVVQRSKVDRCRAVFRQWAVESEVVVDTKVIDIAEFTDCARTAGETEGMGDYRLMYGRYSVEVEEL